MIEMLAGQQGASKAPEENILSGGKGVTLAGPILSNHRETAENYVGEIFRSSRYRAAECRDGLQWLLQLKRPRISPGGAAWDTLAYCVTRSALARLHRAHSGSQVALEIAGLPERFRRRDLARKEMPVTTA